MEDPLPSRSLIDGTCLLVDKPQNWTSFDVVNKIRIGLKPGWTPDHRTRSSGILVSPGTPKCRFSKAASAPIVTLNGV